MKVSRQQTALEDVYLSVYPFLRGLRACLPVQHLGLFFLVSQNVHETVGKLKISTVGRTGILRFTNPTSKVGAEIPRAYPTRSQHERVAAEAPPCMHVPTEAITGQTCPNSGRNPCKSPPKCPSASSSSGCFKASKVSSPKAHQSGPVGKHYWSTPPRCLRDS